jgi:DNA-binding XRE family transcriptional regulator
MKRKWSQTGLNIRTLRKSHNLSIQDLAEKIGVSPKTITNIENGATQPRLALMDNIAAVFSCTVEHLLNLQQYKVSIRIEAPNEAQVSIPTDVSELKKEILDVSLKLEQILKKWT